MRLKVESPLEVVLLLSMGLAMVWGVAAVYAVALRVEELIMGPCWK